MNQKNNALYYIYIFLFALSGFAGLIYESIWSHYLKLFLGHAAYAQVLVLAIFMGGLAIGSAIAAKFTTRIRNLLLAYAIVEALLGVAALLFHRIFTISVDFTFNFLLPSLSSPSSIQIAKWTIASLLILPQCILLGTTFPLLVGGILRRFPQSKGYSLALLYFTNSVGAVLGVLISGFILINLFGLPGTILTAGLINCFIALVIWMIQKWDIDIANVSYNYLQEQKMSATPIDFVYRSLLACAAITGAASFMYEVAWLRMLAMVLGSSTHAFELMLSAFILGLALGGFWIRNRLDSTNDPISFLAIIQLIMGVLAILTLPLYNQTFDMMAWLMTAAAKTDEGYLFFNFGSHVIAMLMMLPATFCAGMTLPLITHLLFKNGFGESAIGRTYAFNTIGSILGVIVAVLVLMPLVGVKGILSTGGLLDISLGITLLYLVGKRREKLLNHSKYIVGIISFIAIFVIIFSNLDIQKMSSGVYRYGSISPQERTILFHRDGKTATVHVEKTIDNLYTLRTNGKPDASVQLSNNQRWQDESTMLLLGALPLLIYPQAEQVAVIGMGTGITSHITLTSPVIKNVTTIEIEPAIVEASEYFRPRSELVFSDPRSHIVIEDAKTYFSTQKQKFDIIISEPSNPWVSGVSSLFTDEFYRQIKLYLSANGVFVQWLHIYEMNSVLLETILKALDNQFSDYRIFANGSDLIVIASPSGRLPDMQPSALEFPRLRNELLAFNFESIENLQTLYIADKSLISWLVRSVSSNSDFFPILDQGAVKQRFMKNFADVFTNLRNNPIISVVPNIHADRYHKLQAINNNREYTPTRIRDAQSILNIAKTRNVADKVLFLHESTQRHLLVINSTTILDKCDPVLLNTQWMSSFKELMNTVLPFASREANEIVYRYLYDTLGKCANNLSDQNRYWLSFYQSLAVRDIPTLGILALKLLPEKEVIQDTADNRLLLSALFIFILETKKVTENKAEAYLSRYVPEGEPDPALLILIEMLLHKETTIH